MTESCTIYCKVLNLDEICRLLYAHFPSAGPLAGDSMLVRGRGGSLRLTHKVFRERGDDFCRLLLSTCAFVEDMRNADAGVKKRLVSHIESCELILGVVAEPAFGVDERYDAVVFAIAKALDGVVFNGEEMLDANGEALVAAVKAAWADQRGGPKVTGTVLQPNSAADAALAEATTVANDEAGAVTTAAGQEATAVSDDGQAQAGFVDTAATAEATFEQSKAEATRDYDNAVATAGVDYVATLSPEEAEWFLWWDSAGGAGIDITAARQDAIDAYNTAVANANVTRVTAIGDAELAQAGTDGGAEVALGTDETSTAGEVADAEADYAVATATNNRDRRRRLYFSLSDPSFGVPSRLGPRICRLARSRARRVRHRLHHHGRRRRPISRNGRRPGRRLGE